MWAEFKEKTYECYFLAELGRLTTIAYSPDQNDEGLLGFDGAFFLPIPTWRVLFPLLRARRWRHLVGMTASEINDIGAELDARLPPFKLNLFVQYKRPEWLHRSNATEWASWNAPYFRYTIESKQQGLLETIVTSAAGRAAVVYAAPAFWQAADLFAHATAGTIVDHSNVASVGLLTGHDRLTYDAPGHFGIGHSDPENVESPSIMTIIRDADDNDGLPFTKQMKSAAELIQRGMEGDEGASPLWRAAREALLGEDEERALPRARGSWIDAIVSIVAFEQAFSIRMTAIG